MSRPVLFLLFLAIVSSVEGKCPSEVIAPLPFVLEYGLWRGWTQAVVYTPGMEPGCEWATLRLVKCMGVNGIATAMNTDQVRVLSRIGIVVLTSHARRQNVTLPFTKLIDKLFESNIEKASYDWLIVSLRQNYNEINKILNVTSIRFDQNLIIAYYHIRSELRLSNLCDHNFVQRNNRKERKMLCNDERNGHCIVNSYFRSSERFKHLSRNRTYLRHGVVLPLLNSGFIDMNVTKDFEMTNISSFILESQIRRWQHANNYHFSRTLQIHVVQYLKVRINSTLYARLLGSWSHEQSMSGVEVPYSVEARNFLGEELVFGRSNSSDGSVSLDDGGPSSPASLDDVMEYLTIRLNATPRTRYYNKLGLRTYEGTWSGLLGAIMENSVDVALEPVTAHTTLRQDMEFIFPIAKTMCNIYIRQQETSTVRDIFLAPFSARLVVCVGAVAVAAAVAVVAISHLAPSAQDHRRMGCVEALLWSTGILCQQGGTWTPPTSAASILLLVCLLFAVVTYNAYAAFITSVLSVRVASVDTVAAVLLSPNFKIGYIRNGADQMYLMSTKDVQLNAFYIRGYSNAENLVSSAEEGLARAASQDYAFFAGQRAARSTLRSLSQVRGRCAVREVPVPSTRAHLAFPLPKHSPYARTTLVSLLQLRAAGSLARLEAALVPAMPQCAPPPGFTSARATDVRSALFILVTGYITALLIGFIEYCWKNRKELGGSVSNRFTHCLDVVKQI